MAISLYMAFLVYHIQPGNVEFILFQAAKGMSFLCVCSIECYADRSGHHYASAPNERTRDRILEIANDIIRSWFNSDTPSVPDMQESFELLERDKEWSRFLLLHFE